MNSIRFSSSQRSSSPYVAKIKLSDKSYVPQHLRADSFMSCKRSRYLLFNLPSSTHKLCLQKHSQKIILVHHLCHATYIFALFAPHSAPQWLHILFLFLQCFRKSFPSLSQYPVQLLSSHHVICMIQYFTLTFSTDSFPGGPFSSQKASFTWSIKVSQVSSEGQI